MGTAARVIVTRHGAILRGRLLADIRPGEVSGGNLCHPSHVAAVHQGAVVLSMYNGLLGILWPAVGLRSAGDARMRP